MFFGIPAVIAGCVAGWFLAIQMAEGIIEGFGEIMADAAGRHLLPTERIQLVESYMEMGTQPINRLVIFMIIILFAMLLLVTIGNLLNARKSALDVLKGAR